MTRFITIAFSLILLGFVDPHISRGSIIFSGIGTGSSSNNLAASAEFSVSSNQLMVQLTNTASGITLQNQDVLMGVFFDITNPIILTPINSGAAIASGFLGESELINPNSLGLGYYDVSGEWAYVQQGSTPALDSLGMYGLGTAGRGVFGNGDVMNGLDRNGAVAPDGADFGLVSASTPLNSGINQNKLPYIQDSVTFTLESLPDSFDLGRIENVWFAYGTASNDPAFQGTTTSPPPVSVPTPEPSTLAIWSVLGGIGLIVGHRRRRRKAA